MNSLGADALLLALVSLIALTCGPAPVHAAPNEDPDRHVAEGERAEQLATLVERLPALGFAGAVLIADKGQVLVAMGVGAADREGKEPCTANTLFELASFTKQFTAAAILELAQRKKLALGDSIAEHLPRVPDDCKKITIEQLLRHTSGIPGTNSTGRGDDLAAVVPLFLRGGPQHEPGTHWEYWNQGYALLAGIIERRGGTSYAKYCKKRLFAPAGSKDALFCGDRAPRRAQVAIGESRHGPARSALEPPYDDYGYQYRGMGGAVMHLWDLWRWDVALRGDDLLNAESKRALFRPGLQEYALGWFVRRVRGPSGERLVQMHGGSVRGFVCDVRRYPEREGLVAVLCKRDWVPASKIAELLEGALFGEPFAPPPDCLDTETRAHLVGAYTDPRGVRLTIEADGELTRARIDWAEGMGFPPTRALVGKDENGLVFYEWSTAVPLQTETGEDGKVTALRLHGQRLSR